MAVRLHEGAHNKGLMVLHAKKYTDEISGFPSWLTFTKSPSQFRILKMSPRLNITGLRNGKVYSSTEPVTGVVHLKAGGGAPVDFQVTATLEGIRHV